MSKSLFTAAAPSDAIFSDPFNSGRTTATASGANIKKVRSPSELVQFLNVQTKGQTLADEYVLEAEELWERHEPQLLATQEAQNKLVSYLRDLADKDVQKFSRIMSGTFIQGFIAERTKNTPAAELAKDLLNYYSQAGSEEERRSILSNNIVQHCGKDRFGINLRSEKFLQLRNSSSSLVASLANLGAAKLLAADIEAINKDHNEATNGQRTASKDLPESVRRDLAEQELAKYGVKFDETTGATIFGNTRIPKVTVTAEGINAISNDPNSTIAGLKAGSEFNFKDWFIGLRSYKDTEDLGLKAAQLLTVYTLLSNQYNNAKAKGDLTTANEYKTYITSINQMLTSSAIPSKVKELYAAGVRNLDSNTHSMIMSGNFSSEAKKQILNKELGELTKEQNANVKDLVTITAGTITIKVPDSANPTAETTHTITEVNEYDASSTPRAKKDSVEGAVEAIREGNDNLARTSYTNAYQTVFGKKPNASDDIEAVNTTIAAIETAATPAEIITRSDAAITEISTKNLAVDAKSVEDKVKSLVVSLVDTDESNYKDMVGALKKDAKGDAPKEAKIKALTDAVHSVIAEITSGKAASVQGLVTALDAIGARAGADRKQALIGFANDLVNTNASEDLIKAQLDDKEALKRLLTPDSHTGNAKQAAETFKALVAKEIIQKGVTLDKILNGEESHYRGGKYTRGLFANEGLAQDADSNSRLRMTTVLALAKAAIAKDPSNKNAIADLVLNTLKVVDDKSHTKRTKMLNAINAADGFDLQIKLQDRADALENTLGDIRRKVSVHGSATLTGFQNTTLSNEHKASTIAVYDSLQGIKGNVSEMGKNPDMTKPEAMAKLQELLKDKPEALNLLQKTINPTDEINQPNTDDNWLTKIISLVQFAMNMVGLSGKPVSLLAKADDNNFGAFAKSSS